MQSKLYRKKIKEVSKSHQFFGSHFVYDLAAGDILIVIPPTGKLIYISTTSLANLLRLICKIGGPNGPVKIEHKTTTKVRTYTLSIERRFLHPENKILNARKHDYRKRSAWTDDEWIKFFQGVGRNKGAYRLFITTKFRELKNLKAAQKLYWELIEKAGLNNTPPKPISLTYR